MIGTDEKRTGKMSTGKGGQDMAVSELEAIHLSKSYTIDDRQVMVLDNVHFSLAGGEFLVIEGKSGSGKSTLLGILSGLDKPDKGRVVVTGMDITDLKEDELASFRNLTIGYVFQAFHLVPSLTALENIMFPAELHHDAAARAKAMQLLQRVDLQQRKNNFPHQLSGGEKQRVAICRALVNSPRLIFADEPTGNLDSANGDIILNLLLDLRREYGTTLVLATHSQEISDMADRVVRLVDGRIGSSSRHGG
jgi:putative ABC transport system ATP-binding protein